LIFGFFPGAEAPGFYLTNLVILCLIGLFLKNLKYRIRNEKSESDFKVGLFDFLISDSLLFIPYFLL